MPAPSPRHHEQITPPTKLEAEVGRYLEMSGFVRHKCCHPGGDGVNHNIGGVCITPEPNGDVTVGWCTHPMKRHDHGIESKISTVVRMTRALHEELRDAGFDVTLDSNGRMTRVREWNVVPLHEGMLGA